MVKLITTNIVGTASKSTWSQAQTVSYDENHQVMLVVQLTCDADDSLVDLTTIGVEIISEIEKKGQVIENDVELKKIVDEVVDGVTEGLGVEILVATLKGENLSLYGKGQVDAYLSRSGKLARLKENWKDGSSVSGVLKVGDVIVLTLSKLVEIVGLTKFREILIQDDSPAELLIPLLHTQAETSGVAAIVGEVKNEVEEVKIGLWQNIINKEPNIRLRSEVPRKSNLWIGGVIFILLIIMIGIGMTRRVKQVAEADFAILNSSVNSKIDETLSVGDLNPERARYLLTQARGEVEAYLATDITNEYKQKGKKLVEDIASADERAFKKNDIQLTTLVELPILIDGLTASKMKSDGKENLIFLDSSNARIVAMNLTDRSRQVIEYLDQEQFVDIAVIDQKIYGIQKNGVFEEEFKKDNVKKVIEADEFWKDPVYIEMFAGNVYILDREQKEIWKYPTLGDTFGGRRRWFAVGITPDLTNVVDMKVVGDIWLLTSTGKLERYSRGAPVVFGMEGFPGQDSSKKLSNPTAVWVSDSAVYVLEAGASRVVVFGIDGKYQAQYANSEFVKATDLVVVDNKGYVLIDNTVKEFGL